MPRKLTVAAVLMAGLIICTFAAIALSARATSADPQLDSEEQAFVTLINNYRSQNGLGPLSIDWEMQASSDWMSADMGINGYFDHYDHCVGDCVNGHQYDASHSRDPWTRMCAFGYCYSTAKGENIAAGYTTAQSVFTAWQNSPGHNANMLGASYTAMGISRVYRAGSLYGWYWTNDFGGVNSNAAPPGSATPTTPPTLTPSPTASPTKSPSPTPSPTPTPSLTPTPTPTPSPILTPSPAPTPSCPSGAVPPWPVPADDTDCDGFASSQEAFIGTDPTRACGPYAWPPDINNDQKVNLSDVLKYSPVFNSSAPGPPYNVRYDLNGDNKINLSDVMTFAPFFNRSCTP